jgi:hypothetical protein
MTIISGRINGIHAEPGTVLGPTIITREWIVVVENDERGVIIGYASQPDVAAVLSRPARSVAEHQIQASARPPWGEWT